MQNCAQLFRILCATSATNFAQLLDFFERNFLVGLSRDNDVDDQDDDVTSDVTELTFRQQLELSMQASQCLFSPVTSPPSDADRQLQTAIKTEMALFATTGHRGRFLQQALMTVPATSVQVDRAYSAAGILCSKLRSSLGDNTLDTLCFLRSYYRDSR